MKYFENRRFFWIKSALKSLTNFGQCLHLYAPSLMLSHRKDIFFVNWKRRISAQNMSASEWALHSSLLGAIELWITLYNFKWQRILWGYFSGGSEFSKINDISLWYLTYKPITIWHSIFEKKRVFMHFLPFRIMNLSYWLLQNCNFPCKKRH